MVRERLSVTNKISDCICDRNFTFRSLVLIIRVLQHAVHEERIVEVIRVGLAEQGAVQVKHGDAVEHGVDLALHGFGGEQVDPPHFKGVLAGDAGDRAAPVKGISADGGDAVRNNQIGDEGKSSMTVEGESAAWLTDLFAPYEKDIKLFLDRENQTVSGGSIRFL